MVKVLKVNKVQIKILPEKHAPHGTGHGRQSGDPFPDGLDGRSLVDERPIAGRLDGSLNQRCVRLF